MCGSNGSCTTELDTKTRIWINAKTTCNKFTEWADNSKIVYTNYAIGKIWLKISNQYILCFPLKVEKVVLHTRVQTPQNFGS